MKSIDLKLPLKPTEEQLKTSVLELSSRWQCYARLWQDCHSNSSGLISSFEPKGSAWDSDWKGRSQDFTTRFQRVENCGWSGCGPNRVAFIGRSDSNRLSISSFCSTINAVHTDSEALPFSNPAKGFCLKHELRRELRRQLRHGLSRVWDPEWEGAAN